MELHKKSEDIESVSLARLATTESRRGTDASATSSHFPRGRRDPFVIKAIVGTRHRGKVSNRIARCYIRNQFNERLFVDMLPARPQSVKTI
jgi:hypothetical protein